MGFVITTVINLGFEMKNDVEDEKAHVYFVMLCVQRINIHCRLGILWATKSLLSLPFLVPFRLLYEEFESVLDDSTVKIQNVKYTALTKKSIQSCINFPPGSLLQ